MFARFNLLARPLEDERPRVMTIEQLKTSYLFHLREIRSEAQDLELNRDIREAERNHKIRGMPPLTRYEIHELVLRQDRELVIEETKLRAVGLSRVSVKDRPGPRVNERLGSTAKNNNASPAEHRGRLPEKRNCNRCNKRGHLAYACPDRTPPLSGSAPPTRGEMGEAKRAAPDTPNKDGKPSTRARTVATERVNNSNTRGAGRGGGRSNSYSGGGRNAYDRKSKVGSHSTVGAVCAHCGRENPTDAQCWKLHPELNPYAARAEHANMVRIADEDKDNNRQ